MIETLREIGLNRRESRCYLALLELGSSKVGPIIKKAEIPSSKIYEVLEKLIKKGLVSYVIRGSIKHYQASDPKNLLSYISDKKKKIETILPELIKKQQFSLKQNVEMFEGYKAVFQMFNHLISDGKPKEPYLVFFVSRENKDEAARRMFRTLTLRRKEKKLDTKLLKNISEYRKEKHTKLQLKYTKFNLPQGITIFRDNVIILSWTENPTAIKIKSKDFANQWREFFLELWKSGKK